MDKRKNKILIGCLALLLVMTVGYALFSENITINGTATAKGDFVVETTCVPGISSDLYSENITGAFGEDNIGDYDNPSDLLANYPEGAYKNDSCIVTDNKVSFKTEFSMPGARRYFTVKISNTGSIPITIDDNTSSENVTIEAIVTKNDGTTNTLTTQDFVNLFTFATNVGTATNSTITDTGFVIESGESYYLVMRLAFPEKLEHAPDRGGYTDYLTFAKSAELKVFYEMTISFKQVTAD